MQLRGIPPLGQVQAPQGGYGAGDTALSETLYEEATRLGITMRITWLMKDGFMSGNIALQGPDTEETGRFTRKLMDALGRFP
jgi:hypothetical protein